MTETNGLKKDVVSMEEEIMEIMKRGLFKKTDGLTIKQRLSMEMFYLRQHRKPLDDEINRRKRNDIEAWSDDLLAEDITTLIREGKLKVIDDTEGFGIAINGQ